VPADRIRVWIPESQRDEYARELPAELYRDLVELDYVQTSGSLREGPYGSGLARNLITREASAGDRVIQMDDDLDGLWIATDPKTKTDVGDLCGLFSRAFDLASSSGAHLWGCYPAPNPYFMRPRARLDLSYIGGGLFGVIHRGPEFAATELVLLDDKEDFERSLRFYVKDGVLLRLESVSWHTTGYHGEGGMQVTRTPDRVHDSALALSEIFPDFCKLNLKKKSGWAEVRLRDPRLKGSRTRPLDLAPFISPREEAIA
jgi:hypothetical protein